jgi:hypothetical protein
VSIPTGDATLLKTSAITISSTDAGDIERGGAACFPSFAVKAAAQLHYRIYP